MLGDLFRIIADLGGVGMQLILGVRADPAVGRHPQMFRFPRLRRDDFYLCHVFHFPVSFLSTHKLPHDPQNIQNYSQTVCGEYFSLASLLA